MDDDFPNDVLARTYRSGCVRDADGRPTRRAMRTPVHPHLGRALYRHVRRTRPRRTLEIGLAYGLSALWICQAHRDNGEGGVHTAIDPKQSGVWRGIGLLNVERAGLDGTLRFHEEPSHLALPALLAEGERFDLVLVDGLHLFDYTLVDFFYSDLLLAVGGHVVVDDVWMPSVRKVVMYALRNRRYRLDPDILGAPPGLLERLRIFRRREEFYHLNRRALLDPPIDLMSLLTLGYLGWRGSLTHAALRKLGEDDRRWDVHRAF